MKVLLTGGTGYIGSHTCISLIENGFEPVIIDNLSNSKSLVVNRIEKITGVRPDFIEGDILDTALLTDVLKNKSIEAVIHFAGLKAVGESVEKPLLYYQNNVKGTISLCEAMKEADVKNLVFSSSCTVYGDPETVPITESAKTGNTSNPYGTTKYIVERFLSDLYTKDWGIVLLRYFNPVGAHESGLIGEDPNDIPNNLMPFITQVAVGRREHLNVFGNDYDTHDGTGVRDYIHVMDLADGHLKAMNKLRQKPGFYVYNLGTGKGCSVMDVVRAFEKVSGKKISCKMAPRRAGDIACNYADPSLAQRELDWKAVRDISTICEDSWRWQSNNPSGYTD